MQQHQEKKSNDSKEIDEQRWQAVCNRDQVCGMVSSFSQCVRQVCTVALAVLPEEPIEKMFRFTIHQHRLRLRAIELVNAANPIK